MINDHTASLEKEIRQFKAEKEKIRSVIGQIGGKSSQKNDRMLNIIFLGLMGLLFTFDILRHLLHVPVPLPPLFSIEISILLVSVKIIWMIQKQTRVEHFQFWILNSIEFRLTDLSNRLLQLESLLKEDK